MKILVVKLHALGDLVIHTPAFERLWRGLPEAEIHLLTTDWAAPAVSGLQFFNETISVPSGTFFGDSLQRIGGLSRLWNKLRRRNYDAIVSFHRSSGINSFLKLCGKSRWFFCYSDTDTARTVALDESRHSAPNACDLADLVLREIAGVDLSPLEQNYRYYWHVSSSESDRAREILNSVGIQKGEAALLFPGGGRNPRTTAPERQWTRTGFAELAEWFGKEIGLKPVLVGSNYDMEACSEVAASSKTAIVNICGKTDIRTTAAIMDLSKIVLTNDSAPLHISAAVGTLTVGIFGPTGAAVKRPPGEHVTAVSLGLPCSPCYYGLFRGCIYKTIKCMDELPSERVIAATMELLNQKKIAINE